MSTGDQLRMAAPGPSVRPPIATSQKPSRLPQHRSRPSTVKSRPETPASSQVSHIGSSHEHGANRRGERITAHKTTQVGLNRMSLQGRQVANEVPLRRWPQRRPDVTGPAAVTGHGHLGNGGIIDDSSYAVRMADSPSCGVRMSELRSAGRHQQPESPTSSIRSSSTASGRHAAATRLSYDPSVGVQRRRTAKPRDTALSHHASTSSVDSMCSQHDELVTPRHSVSLSTSSSVTDRQYTRSSSACSASQYCPESVMSQEVAADEITSSRSSGLKPPMTRDLQRDKFQRRSDGCLSTSGICRPTDDVRSTEHQQRPATVIVEPRRRYYHLWRLSATDVDDFGIAGSMSSIAPIDSSSSSSGTLTDDADESSGESTSTAGGNSRRRDRDHLDVFALPSTELAFSKAPPPLHRTSITTGHKTRTQVPSRVTRPASSSSSELSSPPSAIPMVVQQEPVKHYSKNIQRIGSFGMTPHAPVNKHSTSPPAQSQKCGSTNSAANRLRNRPAAASASDVLAPGSKSNNLLSHRRLPSESTTAQAKNAARHVAHSSSVAPIFGRCQQRVFADISSAQLNLSPIETSKPPNSPLNSYVQKRQTNAAKKAISAAGVSNSKSSINHVPVSSSSKVACQSPLQRASITNMHAASSALRRAGSCIPLHTNNVNKDSTNVVNKSVANRTASVKAPERAKPFTAAAVKQGRSSQSEIVHSTASSHPSKIAMDMPIPSTRSTKTQTSSVVVTRPADSDRGNYPTTVTRRPPPPPSKLKKPGFVPSMTTAVERRRVTVTEQHRRPASTDCSTVSSTHRQSVDVYCKKSESCTNVAKLSTSIEDMLTTRKPTEGALNKNAQLAKSYDCITPIRNRSNSAKQNSHVISSQAHSFSSLVDMPPRKLARPYSAINKCSTFARRIIASKEVHPITTDCNAEIGIENVAANHRSSLSCQTRASGLFDLPEIDEYESDCQMSLIDQPPTDETNKGNDGILRSTVDKTVLVECTFPSTPQKPTGRYKYRTEYSTFLDAVSPKDDDRLTVKSAQVANTNSSSCSHRDCSSVTIQQGTNDTENSCASKITCTSTGQHSTHDVEGFRFISYIETDDKCCVSATRPVMLSTEVSMAEDAMATAEAADKPLSEDNYVVTYESDSIVVLDREPVIDCLTPDGDVVSTQLRQLLTVLSDSVGSASGAVGLPRTLPLSESGYDTWKSSQGSVTVATASTGGTCVVQPDFSVEQCQKREEDATLRSCQCDHVKTSDTLSAELILEKNVYTGGCETEGVPHSLALSSDRDNIYDQSTNSTADAPTETKDDDGRRESASRDDDRGRVADDSVEDSAVRDAQMFASICSYAVEPVAVSASFRGKSCVADSMISQCSEPSLSPHDNAISGFVDPSDICFSSQTILSNAGDILPTFSASPNNTAHQEYLNEEVHYRHHVDEEANRTSDNSADVHNETRRFPAIISTKTMTNHLNADGDDVVDMKQIDEREDFSEVPQQLNLSGEKTESVTPSASPVVTAAVSDSASLDPYETICDDLLESVDVNSSDDSETSRPPSTSAAFCSTDVLGDKASELSEELATANNRDTVLTEAVVQSNISTNWQTTRSTVQTASPLWSTAMTSRLPVMASRHVRTNFSVVYRQATSQPTVGLSRHGGDVEAKASTPEMLSNVVDQEPDTLGCRRALAVLASRLDDHSRRRLAETNVDGRLMYKSTAMDHDTDVATASAISLSSEVKPLTSSPTVTRYNDATAADNDHYSDLQNVQSPVNVHDKTSVSVESKLPISVTSSPHSSVLKKPSTLRKLLSSKLTNAIRRTQTKL